MRSDNLGSLGGLDLTAELLELFEELPSVMFCLKDREGRYVAVNSAFVRRTRESSSQAVLGKRAEELFVPELAERYNTQDSHVLNSGIAVKNLLEIIRRPGGAPGWYVTTKLPLNRLVGETMSVVAVASISTDLRSADMEDSTLQGLSRVVDVVQTRLDQRPVTVPRTAELAQAAGCSISTLDRQMRRVFGLSTRQFVLKARIDRAMRLLTETTLPLAQVAHQSGFYDQPSFTRQLARLTGETPAQFRRRSHEMATT